MQGEQTPEGGTQPHEFKRSKILQGSDREANSKIWAIIFIMIQLIGSIQDLESHHKM